MRDTEEFDVEEVIKKYGDMVYRIALVYGNTIEDQRIFFKKYFCVL